MEALNVAAEYRKYQREIAQYNEQVKPVSQTMYVNEQVRSGAWVEDDGDYYTGEEWDSQYAQQESMPYPEAHYADNFRSWLDETEPE